MYLKKIVSSFLFIILSSIYGASAHEINNIRPLMMEDKNYTEYWEQYFYLDDGSLVTSQFLVANLPWPVGKDHGIMLGTLVTPDGELYVIKNGRDFGKWGYKNEALDMFIHTHRLSGFGNNVNVHLENTMGIVDLNLKSTQAPLNHKSFSSENGFIEASFYAPSLKGSGNWQLGPEAGFKPFGPVHNVSNATGFGVHVLMTDKVDKLIKSWTRSISVTNDKIKPFLSVITRPDDTQDIIFKLFDGENTVDEFNKISIKYNDMTKEKDVAYPKSIEITATSDKGTLKGTFTYNKKFSHFNLTDHLNFFEKTFAKSNPKMVNFRYLADYNLVYKTSLGEQTFSGKALNEYLDIAATKKAPPKKRRRRR